MENMEQKSADITEIYPDAYRAGIITRDGLTYIGLDFGQTIAMVDTGDENDVQTLVRVAVSPDDLKILFERILQIGVRYSPDFWDEYTVSQ